MIDQSLIDRIVAAVGASSLARYSWDGRGTAPRAYLNGVALVFADCYARLLAGGDRYVNVMAAPNSHNSDRDALSWFAGIFDHQNMSNNTAGADTLRHLFVLLTGLGMRESNGQYSCGRDRSANNTSSDTCEAGAWQMSWDARGGAPLLVPMLNDRVQSPLSPYFKVGIRTSDADAENFGSGAGLQFQEACKNDPAFAAQAAAVGLRTIRTHWGPINRHEAEIRPEADKLFMQVQALVDAAQPKVTARNGTAGVIVATGTAVVYAAHQYGIGTEILIGIGIAFVALAIVAWVVMHNHGKK